MVCLGLAVLDVVQRVPGPVRWGHKHVSSAAEVVAGGPATNAAICAARLLGGATLVTGLGGTPAADAVRAELAAYGVRVIDLAPPSWPLPVAACLVDDAGERTVVSPGALATSWSLSEAAAAAVDGARVLLLDGHHPSAAAAALARASAAQPGARRILDAGSAKPHTQAWLAQLDVVAGSADYAAGLGLDLAGALAHALAAGAGAAVLTDGPAEVIWAEAGEPPRRRTPPVVRAVDTLGAGDAFHGALAAWLALGHCLDDAVSGAIGVASARVAHAGARGWLAGLAPIGGGPAASGTGPPSP